MHHEHLSGKVYRGWGAFQGDGVGKAITAVLIAAGATVLVAEVAAGIVVTLAVTAVISMLERQQHQPRRPTPRMQTLEVNVVGGKGGRRRSSKGGHARFTPRLSSGHQEYWGRTRMGRESRRPHPHTRPN